VNYSSLSSKCQPKIWHFGLGFLLLGRRNTFQVAFAKQLPSNRFQLHQVKTEQVLVVDARWRGEFQGDLFLGNIEEIYQNLAMEPIFCIPIFKDWLSIL
jgi:hypothetical protein